MYLQNPYALSIEELAVHQICKNAAGNESTGVRYARKTEFTEKQKARGRILSLLSRKKFPKGIKILTMPGMDWAFELQLLALREGGHWRKRTQASRSTWITAVELDPSIYRMACISMPRKPDSAIVNYTKLRLWASYTTGTDAIARFHNCNVFNLMKENDKQFDVAWLDFTGPITEKVMDAIKPFYEAKVAHILIVTGLAARYDQATNLALMEHGELEGWFQHALPGQVKHCFRYQDGHSPMIQYAVEKPTA